MKLKLDQVFVLTDSSAIVKKKPILEKNPTKSAIIVLEEYNSPVTVFVTNCPDYLKIAKSILDEHNERANAAIINSRINYIDYITTASMALI